MNTSTSTNPPLSESSMPSPSDSNASAIETRLNSLSEKDVRAAAWVIIAFTLSLTAIALLCGCSKRPAVQSVVSDTGATRGPAIPVEVTDSTGTYRRIREESKPDANGGFHAGLWSKDGVDPREKVYLRTMDGWFIGTAP